MKFTEALKMRAKLLKLARQRNQLGGVKCSPHLKNHWDELIWMNESHKLIPDDHIYHIELKTVENNPRNVTDNKDRNNADEDCCHVDFMSNLRFV
jgi:hypothetical protein